MTESQVKKRGGQHSKQSGGIAWLNPEVIKIAQKIVSRISIPQATATAPRMSMRLSFTAFTSCAGRYAFDRVEGCDIGFQDRWKYESFDFMITTGDRELIIFEALIPISTRSIRIHKLF